MLSHFPAFPACGTEPSSVDPVGITIISHSAENECTRQDDKIQVESF